MPRFKVYATVVGSKYIGEVEAGTKEEAIDLAWEHPETHVGVCVHCSKQIEDPQIDEMQLEEIE